jgi:hypothetical protein
LIAPSLAFLRLIWQAAEPTGKRHGDNVASILLLLLGLMVVFAIGRSVLSAIRLARSPAPDRRQVTLAWKLGTALLTGVGLLAVVVGSVYSNLFYVLLGAYLVFTAAHYYTVRRLP